MQSKLYENEYCWVLLWRYFGLAYFEKYEGITTVNEPNLPMETYSHYSLLECAACGV